MAELWHESKWQVVAANEVLQNDLEAKFKAAGLPFIRFVNHVPQFNGDVDYGQVQEIAEGSLTQEVTPINETILDAPEPVQTPKKKKPRKKRGDA